MSTRNNNLNTLLPVLLPVLLDKAKFIHLVQERSKRIKKKEKYNIRIKYIK